jgi:hypothetical protein
MKNTAEKGEWKTYEIEKGKVKNREKPNRKKPGNPGRVRTRDTNVSQADQNATRIVKRETNGSKFD